MSADKICSFPSEGRKQCSPETLFTGSIANATRPRTVSADADTDFINTAEDLQPELSDTVSEDNCRTSKNTKCNSVRKKTGDYLPLDTSPEEIAQIILHLVNEMTEKERAILVKTIYAEIKDYGGGQKKLSEAEDVLNTIVWRAVAPFGGDVYGKVRPDGTRSLISVILSRVNPKDGGQYSPLNGFTTGNLDADIKRLNRSPVDTIGNSTMRKLKSSDVAYQMIDKLITEFANGDTIDRTDASTHFLANGVSQSWSAGRPKYREGGHKFYSPDGEIPKAWREWPNARVARLNKEAENATIAQAARDLSASDENPEIALPQPAESSLALDDWALASVKELPLPAGDFMSDEAPEMARSQPALPKPAEESEIALDDWALASVKKLPLPAGNFISDEAPEMARGRSVKAPKVDLDDDWAFIASVQDLPLPTREIIPEKKAETALRQASNHSFSSSARNLTKTASPPAEMNNPEGAAESAPEKGNFARSVKISAKTGNVAAEPVRSLKIDDASQLSDASEAAETKLAGSPPEKRPKMATLYVTATSPNTNSSSVQGLELNVREENMGKTLSQWQRSRRANSEANLSE